MTDTNSNYDGTSAALLTKAFAFVELAKLTLARVDQKNRILRKRMVV